MIEVRRQLALIRDRVESLRPEIHRQLALYLQVMRKGLLHEVQQACFHLATQVHPERYGTLSSMERVELHRRLQVLVQRCTSLMTIEQLSSLGRQLEQEQRNERRRRQSAILASLEEDDESEGESLPDGSIRLGMDLPLSADLFSEGLAGLAGLPGFSGATGHPDALSPETLEPEDAELDELEQEDPGPEDPDPDDALEEGAGADPFIRHQQEPWPSQESSRELKLLETLFTMASETLGREREHPEGEEGATGEEGEDGPGGPHDDPLLPCDPSALLRWWDSQDQALQRRLRNLSHALNVDLLRLRLTRSLMPVNLLDAVLQGQIDAMPAPANLLRLQLPLPSGAGVLPLETLGMLLRAGDLEYAQPPLRTCRKRLERHRLELRKMAHHHRQLQRRLHALEAERQWLLDDNQVNPGPS